MALTREETAALLARISRLDGRPVDELTVETWKDAFIGTPLTYPTAVHLVMRHYRTDRRRIMPVDLLDAAVFGWGTRWQADRERTFKALES